MERNPDDVDSGHLREPGIFDLPDRPPTAQPIRLLRDWETCADALLKQRGESLYDAAQRALRRSRRIGRVTKRTQVAGIIAAGKNDEDPWARIFKAARLWREYGA